MKIRFALCVLALAGALMGCGGGSGSGSTPLPTDGNFAFGELSGRAAVTNPPVSANSETVVATGFTGSFSILKLRELAPAVDETRIFATSDVIGNGLTSFAIDGSDPVRLTNGTGLATDAFPSAASNGKIVFGRGPAVEIINSDGTGLTTLTTGGFQPSIDYAGDKVSFIGASQVKVINLATQTITPVAMPPADIVYCDVISPDGKTVYYIISLNGGFWVFSSPADGSGTPSQLRELGPESYTQIAVSPDNTAITIANTSVNPPFIFELNAFGGESGSAELNLPGPVNGISYSADGKSWVMCVTPPGLTAGLYVHQINDVTKTFTRITSTASTTETPIWSPFIKDRTLIAAGGGLLGTHACAVILGQMPGSSTRSVVAIDATTPSSVVMTAQNTGNPGLTNVVFSVDADNIIKLAYANSTGWRGIRAIGSGTPVTSANGTLVSFDGGSGQVVSILPFSGTRAEGTRPTIHDNGSIRTFTGNFLAVYDKTGRNLAPRGATTAILDTRTDTIRVGGN